MVELFRENDILGLPFEEAYGGTGTGTLTLLVAVEEISKACATTGLILAVQELGALAIKLAGTEEQKQRWLPRLAAGEPLAAYALTEPGSGSDSAAMRSTARREGDDYVLDGGKRFITNAGVAGLYTVFAKTDPEAGHKGISCFVVESDAPGFSVGRIEPKLGIKGSTTGEVFFDGCRDPGRQPRWARRARASPIAMRVLDRSRPGIAAQALGIAQGATDYALDYAKYARDDGQADRAAPADRGEARRHGHGLRGGAWLLYRFGRMADDGVDGPELTKASAQAKLFCSDTAMWVATEAVQILGGYGYVKEYPVERMMRDAKSPRSTRARTRSSAS